MNVKSHLISSTNWTLSRAIQSTPLRTAQIQKPKGLTVALGDTLELVLWNRRWGWVAGKWREEKAQEKRLQGWRHVCKAMHVAVQWDVTFFLMAYELEDPLAALMISSAKHLKGKVRRETLRIQLLRDEGWGDSVHDDESDADHADKWRYTWTR
jgi:hypothetical protein